MIADIGDALAVATIAHAGQLYGDRPYIEHPIAVARLMVEAYGLYPHLIIPALLHDVVEDSPITCEELQAIGFRPCDVAAVEAVTRRKGELYSDMITRACDHQYGCIVKLADNTHNLSGLAVGDPRVGRYVKARARLLRAYGDDDPWASKVLAHYPPA